MSTGGVRSLGALHGVEVRVDDRTGLGLTDGLLALVAPELDEGATGTATVTYLVTAADGGELVVAVDDLEVCATRFDDAVVDWLARDVDATLARRAQAVTFVHGGVVGWRGLAIVIPGARSSAISTLVAELVRRGADYYSDRFAVVDARGLVHPYRAPLDIGGELQRDLRLGQDEVAVGPLPLGLVVACGGPPAAMWRPEIVTGPRSALPLIEAAAHPREADALLAGLAATLEPTLVTLRGPWPEPVGAAAQLLDIVDEAYVSGAFRTLTDGSTSRRDELVLATEARLHREPARPVTPPRRLLATPYVVLPDFLPRADRDRLAAHALACEAEFTESGVVGDDGQNLLDYEARRSRTLVRERFEEVWDLFDGPLHGILPFARQELGLDWFPPGHVERQLTAHGEAGFFVPHVDTGHPVAASRRISCVYYFHPGALGYDGGELRLYDTWDTPTGTTGAASWTTVLPEDNMLVMFPSDAFHEVRPVHPATDAFADSRFAVTIWFHEGDWPTDALTP